MTYEFRLRLDAGEPLDEDAFDAAIEAVWGAGHHDVQFLSEDGTAWAVVARDAPSLAEAAGSAIRDVEAGGALRVVRVEHEAFATLAQIAARLGRTRQSVQQLAAGQRGPGGFPRPVGDRPGSRVWEWAPVAAWAREHLGWTGERDEHAAFLAAVNGALDLRERLRRLGDAGERATVRALAREPRTARPRTAR